MTVSYLPMNRDFTVFAGATFRQSFHWTSGGLNVDLAGWDAWMPYGSDLNTPIGELSVEKGTIILTDDGHIRLYLTDEQTEAMFGDPTGFPKVRGVTTLVYQLSLKNDQGEVMRFMRGYLYVQYDLKRPVAPPIVVEPDPYEPPVVVPDPPPPVVTPPVVTPPDPDPLPPDPDPLPPDPDPLPPDPDPPVTP